MSSIPTPKKEASFSPSVEVTAALDAQARRDDGTWLNRGLIEDRAYLERYRALMRRASAEH